MNLEAHKFANIFPMIEGEAFEELKKDIKNQGLQQTIVLYEGKILDGRNRYKACKEIGIEPRYEEYKGNKPLEFVISGNLQRRHLTLDQRAGISSIIIVFEKEEAERRQKSGGVVPISEQGRTIEKVSKMIGVGKEKIHQIKKLQESGQQERIDAVISGKLTLQDIKKEDRLEKIKHQREELQKTAIEKPTGLFDVIVIDPPWNYGTDENYNPESFRGTTPYVTMSLEEIKNIKLPIKEDCVLWLWTTNTFLPECYPLLKEWGFELKSMVTWDKQHIGTGKWLRSKTEHCLLAIRGKPFFNNTKWSTLISEKRTEHSAKPEIFYKMVDEICAGRKLDYFARKKRDGWDVYGDEVK